MNLSVSVLSSDYAFVELATVLLEEVGFLVKKGASLAVVDLDTAEPPVNAVTVTVSRDPFRSADLSRPFRNAAFRALCLARFLSLTEEELRARLPMDLSPRTDCREEARGEAPPSEEASLTLTEEGFFYGEAAITLTPTEHRLLAYLYERQGRAVSEAECLGVIGGERNKLTVYISHLREKLDHRFDKRMILTVRRIGYMLK